MDYPQGLSEELAKRLYGSVKVSWASEPFTFDLARSECRDWVARGVAFMTSDDYHSGVWPALINVIRRGTDNSIRVFQFSDGTVYEQTT